MGNAQSAVYKKLSKELPPTSNMGHNDRYEWTQIGIKAFDNDKDREQFIYAVITVATNNGLTYLDEHEFKLLYSRREDNEERLVARIVAIKDGVITAKIEPQTDGATQEEAFKALRKDVEVKLDRILQSVPDRNEAGMTSPVGAGSSDLPPAYSSPSAGMASSKGKK